VGGQKLRLAAQVDGGDFGPGNCDIGFEGHQLTFVAGDSQDKVHRAVVDDAVGVGHCMNFAQQLVGGQVENIDSSVASSVGDEAAVNSRNNGGTVGADLAGNIGNHFAGRGVQNLSMRRTGDKEPVVAAIGQNVIPAAFSADM